MDLTTGEDAYKLIDFLKLVSEMRINTRTSHLGPSLSHLASFMQQNVVWFYSWISVFTEEGSAGGGGVWRGGASVVNLQFNSNSAWIDLSVFFKWTGRFWLAISGLRLNWGTKLCRKVSLLYIMGADLGSPCQMLNRLTHASVSQRHFYVFYLQ